MGEGDGCGCECRPRGDVTETRSEDGRRWAFISTRTTACSDARRGWKMDEASGGNEEDERDGCQVKVLLRAGGRRRGGPRIESRRGAACKRADEREAVRWEVVEGEEGRGGGGGGGGEEEVVMSEGHGRVGSSMYISTHLSPYVMKVPGWVATYNLTT